MSKGPKPPWGHEVDEQHFDSAYNYLSLHWLPKQAAEAVEQLRNSVPDEFLPGDLLRAARLDPLPLDDPLVQRELAKALEDGQFEPALVVNLADGVVIADGVHRLSAAYRIAPQRKARAVLAPSSKDAFQGAP